MKNSIIWIIVRIIVLLIVGLMNTVFIAPENAGTWRIYFGYLLLAIVLYDIVRLVRRLIAKNDEDQKSVR